MRPLERQAKEGIFVHIPDLINLRQRLTICCSAPWTKPLPIREFEFIVEVE
jgi:hypothetical protein